MSTSLMTCERCGRADLLGASAGLYSTADPVQFAVLAAGEGRSHLCGLCATTAAGEIVLTPVRDAVAAGSSLFAELTVLAERRPRRKAAPIAPKPTARRGGRHRAALAAAV
ncbi:hypothetical protein GIS00_12980 [Nakamurella sp. YIM 132087]|uniref:Uncharacterized protein n=1 Tax=Nakamurella alba TaxID=2665158 RepID=A0A7K1FPW0_9ACTN|nr:hypothetical protein [Nakamurella alba]MTD14854.1 hypothetical protein [Nakamurella alba]